MKRAGASAQVIERRQRQLAELASAARAAEASARESLAAIRGLSERLRHAARSRADGAGALDPPSRDADAGRGADALRRRDDEAHDPHLPRHAARLHARSGVDAERDRRRQALLDRRASATRQMPHLRGRRSRASSVRRAPPMWCARPRPPTWTRSATPPSPRSTIRRFRSPPRSRSRSSPRHCRIGSSRSGCATAARSSANGATWSPISYPCRRSSTRSWSTTRTTSTRSPKTARG